MSKRFDLVLIKSCMKLIPISRSNSPLMCINEITLILGDLSDSSKVLSLILKLIQDAYFGPIVIRIKESIKKSFEHHYSISQ